MATTFNIASYVKNATRSLGYVAVETVKDVNPAIAEFADANTDALKEMYTAVRDFKKTARQAKQNLAESEYTKIAKETVSNFFTDLKTGNFYNKDRESKNESGLMDSMGFDMIDDWDVDLDNMDFGDEGGDELTTSTMDNIGQKIAQASGKAAIKSADYMVKANRATTKAMMAQNELLFGKIYSGLAGVNTTIASIGKSIIPSATTHFENSSKFYEHTSSELAKQTGYLEQIYTILNNRYNPPATARKKGKSQYDSIVGINGIPDLKAYADVVKDNFKEMTSVVTSMFSLMNMGGTDGGAGMLRSMASSPVASLMKMGASATTKMLLGKDLERFNKTLGGLFGSAILKMNQKAHNGSGPMAWLAELLGVKTSTKKTINTGNYEKGRVDWNGKDEKALREVIPTQLAQILSALTGQTPKVFNYETGKWTTLGSVQKELSEKVHNVSRNNTTDIRDQFNKYYLDDNASRGITKQSKAFHSFEKDTAAFFHYLTMNNSRIPMNPAQWTALETQLNKFKLFAEQSSSGIMLKSNFRRIKSYYTRNANNGNGHLNMETNGALMNSRNEIGNMYTREENDPSSMYSMLFNSSGLGGATGKNKNNFLTVAVDNKGNNMFFYLQKFYTSLEKIADNTYGGGGGNRRRGRQGQGNPSKSYEVPNNINVNAANAHRNTELSRADRFTDVNDIGATDSVVAEDKNKGKSRADKLKDQTEELIKKNPLIKKLGKVGDVISTLLTVPVKSIRSVLDSADQVMYNFVYGRDKDKENPGILAKILDGFDKTFSTIKTEAKKLFNDKISPFLHAMGDNVANLFGFKSMSDVFKGISQSKFVQGVKSNLKGAAKWVGNSVKSTVLDVGDYFSQGAFGQKAHAIAEKAKGFGKREPAPARSLNQKAEHLMGQVKRFRGSQEAPQAARGGMVTRSGMVSVSEGEMIIPSEMNPLYKGRTNKGAQIRNEIANANQYKASGGNEYWGNYADGTPVVRRPAKGAKIKGNSNFNPLDTRSAGEKMRDSDAYKYADAAIRSAIDYSANAIKSGADSIGYRLFGQFYNKDGERKSDADVKSSTKETMGKIFGEMKAHAPAMGAGAIIGGGVAALTGLVGGPLLGAAAGAAIGLVTKSETAQKALFGDDTKPGLLGKKLGGFIKEKFPKLAKFGVTGGIAGALGVIPGGPIAGLLLGSGLAFATESSGLRDYFFGNEGVFGKGTDEKIKKAMPKALLGSAALAFTGPFGLVGNMMLGAGIGFLSDTDSFKKAFFGTEDSDGNMQGGLLGIIRKDVINPVGDYFKGGAKKFGDYMKKYIFEPTKNLFKPLNQMIGNMFAGAVDFLKGQISEKITLPFMKKLDNILFKPVTKMLGGLAKGALGILKMPGKIYGGVANAIGNKITKSQIKRGTAGHLSAEERELYMEDEKNGLANKDFKTRTYTKAAAGASAEQLRAFKDAMDAKRAQETGDVKEKKQYKQNVVDRVLADTEWKSTIGQDQRLTKAVNDVSKNGGDFTKVYKVIDQLGRQGKLDPEKSSKLTDYIKKQEEQYNAVDQRDNSSIQDEYKKQLAAMGLNPEDIDTKDRSQMRLIESDIRHKTEDAAKNEEEAKKAEGTPEEQQAEAVDSIRTDAQKIADSVSNSETTLTEIRNAIYQQNGIEIPDDTSMKKDASEPDKPGSKTNAQAVVNDQIKKEEAKKESDDNTKVIPTDNGIIVANRDSKGNWEPDVRDAGTKNALKAQEEDREQKSKFYTMFGSMGGVLGGLKDKLFGKKDDKEKKKGIFSTLFDGIKGIFGEGGMFGKVLGALPSLLGPALVGAIGLAVANYFGKNSDEHKNPLKQAEARGETVNHNTFTDTKAGFDSFENSIKGRDLSTYKDGDYQDSYMTDNYLKKGILKNSILKGQTGSRLLSKVPIVGKVLNAPLSAVGKIRNKVLYSKPAEAAGKAISKGIGNSKVVSKLANTGAVKTIKSAGKNFAESRAAGKAAKEFGIKGAEKKAFKTAYSSLKGATGVTDIAATAAETIGHSAEKVAKGGLIEGIITKIKTMVSSAVGKAIKLLGGKGGEKAAEEAGEQLAQAAVKAGPAKVTASFAKSATLVIQLGFIALAVENGWEDAKAILGIIEKPTFPERALAAACNGINEAIPGIGGVIPTDLIFNVVFGILTKFGFINGGELEQKREDAKATVDDYNATNGTTYSIREYIKNVLGEYTTQEKVGNAVKKVGSGIVKGVKTAAGGIAKGAKAVGKGVVSFTKGAAGLAAKGITAVAHSKPIQAIAGGAKKVGSVIAGGAKSLVAGAGKAISGAFDVAKWVAEGATALAKLPAEMFKSFQDPDSDKNDMMNVKLDISEDNPLNGIVQTIGKVIKIPIVPAVWIASLGLKIKKTLIDPVIKRIGDTAKQTIDIQKQAFGFFQKGDISGLFGMEPPDDGDDKTNPIGFISGAVNLVSKVVYAIPTTYSWIGHKIMDVIKKIKNAVATVAPTIQDDLVQTYQLAENGDFTGMWNTEPTVDDKENPLAFVSKATNIAGKIVYSPIAAFHWIGNKIKGVINTVKAGFVAVATTVAGSYESAKTFADAGDFSGMWAADDGTSDQEESSGPLDFIAKATSITSKLVLSPMAAFKFVGNKIKGFFGGVKKAVDVKNLIADLWKYTDNKNDWKGFDSTLDSYKPGDGESGPIAIIDNVITTIVGGVMRMVVKTVRTFRFLGDKIGGFLDKAKDWLTGKDDKEIQDMPLANTDNGTTTTTNTTDTGSGSGVHVSQIDSKFGKRKFGKSTIAQNGCGPAAAATVLRAYGKNASLGDTASFAQARGYVAGSSGVGTRASYFGDILASQGIGSTYTNKQNQIQRYVGTGSPTILLGQDRSNTSKSNSPFGPNPHYVVARGTDRRGNVVVDDPELNGPALYKKSILKNAKLGVLTGGAAKISSDTMANSGLVEKGTRPYGTTVDGNTNQAKFYQFYTQQGFTPEATLGIMGNVEQESGFKPDIIQGNGKGPAAGLFQWENYNQRSKRWAEMDKHAKSKNKDWKDLQSQMEYALAEMQQDSSMWKIPKKKGIDGVETLDDFKQLKDAAKATYAFEYAFERAGKPAMEKRLAATNKYSQQFTGATITNPTTFGTADTSSINTGDTGGGLDSIINMVINSSLGKIFGKIGGAIGNFFAKTFGLNGDKENITGDNSGTLNNIPQYSGNINTNMSGLTPQETRIMNSAAQFMGYKMNYSQKSRYNYNPNGSADCSSTVQGIIKNAISVDPGSYTGAQINSSTGKDVDVNGGKGPNEANLRPGDLLLYQRSGGKVGHVEMYVGNGVRIGHGGGKSSPYGLGAEGKGRGPFASVLSSDADRYMKARRFTSDQPTAITNATGGLNVPTSEVAGGPYTGTGSGLILHDFTKTSVGGNSGVRYSNMDITRPINRHALNTVKSTMRQVGGDSGLSSMDTMKLLQTALEYMKIIADNTSANANIKTIVEILNSMMKVMGASAANNAAVAASNNQPEDTSAIDALDADTQSIMARLKQLSEAV